MWSDPGNRAASLPCPCPQSPSQPQQLSLQSHPNNHMPKVAAPSPALLPHLCQARRILACGAAPAALLGIAALPFAAGMLTLGERLGMQGMQAAGRRGGTDNPWPQQGRVQRSQHL